MFHAADAALIRAASYPQGLVVPRWPDLTVDDPEAWLEWLRETWRLAGFADAVTSAAPDLAGAIVRALNGVSAGTRRLVEATVRYLLRWTTRATPFGYFAGVAPVTLGPQTKIEWGERHRHVTRPDEQAMSRLVAGAERDPARLHGVRVMTNALGYARDGAWVVPCARAEGDRQWDVEIDLTDPVRIAIEAAAAPIAFEELAARTADEVADRTVAEQLVVGLIETGALLTEIRPPMTATDPAAHLARHCGPLARTARDTVDLRLDCALTLPPTVAREAAGAAGALVAVAPRFPGWHDYHQAFLERWGPGAAVPLREVLNVLGFPAGYRGSTRGPASAVFTSRDAQLATLAQQSALDGCSEIVLDDELITALRGNDDRPPIPHTELRFSLAAQTPDDLDHGEFTLTVAGGARHAGVSAARFLHLLTPDESARFRLAYSGLPTVLPGADIVQLSGPPLDHRLTTVARAPELFPVLPVGDFHPDPQWTLGDLAVAGDSQRLWLASRTTGKPVEPLLVNCVVLATKQQPLVRFLAEIWTAWCAPCTPFDWGQARHLPFLPRVRRGRSVLHPARWVVRPADLPARAAPWPEWEDAWRRYGERHRLPREVLLGDDDVRLRLDLAEEAHLAILRSHLDRHPNAALTEGPGPQGWLDGRPAEIMLTLTTKPGNPPALRQVRPAGVRQHRPGLASWLEARFHGPPERILNRLAEGPELPEGWWFLRYPHPTPHLRVRVPVETSTFAEVARDLAGLAEQLHEDGLLADYTLNTYRPETRYGTGATLAAAEAVFAADSRATLMRLPGDRQAATAAGMLAIANGFTCGEGCRWIATHAPRRTGPRLNAGQLALARATGYGDSSLHTALAAYRDLADRDGLNADDVLADLLHLHHARMIGVDPESERHCLRLARAIAHADLARRTR